ncbi:MAG: lysozyme inhibitor LprI family protein [bacterium]|nr:lysozyme inhibitor LprI family protein [bacterium]
MANFLTSSLYSSIIVFSLFFQQTNQEKSLNKEENQQKENIEEPLEKLHPIDKAERDCIAKRDSTQEMNKCTYKARDAWYKEIDKYIGLLKNVTTEEDYNNILNAQIKWKEYQEAEFKAVSIISEKQGTMFQNSAAGIKTDLVKERAIEIKGLYDILVD